MVPKELKYLETHEWVKQEGDVVTVGITDFAIEQLGDIVYVELPAAGEAVAKGASLGLIESVKATSDFYAPVSGEIIETNEQLAKNLDTFKDDAYGDAWLVKIKASNLSELDVMLDAAGYEEQLKGQD